MNFSSNLQSKEEELQSKTISFLRFPLIVGVVLAHSRFNEVVFNGVDIMQGGNFSGYTITSYLFSDILARIIVPIFFLISGFLFFHRNTYFSLGSYENKLKKRVKTLLIPYVFWNLLIIILFYLAQTFAPELMSGRKMLISDYSFADWLWSFWNTNMINDANIHEEAYPICYQFWFIRDLLVVMIFSPLVYLLIKKLRYFPVVIFGVLWMFDCWFNIVGLSIAALFFFSVGSYFSINNKNFINMIMARLPVVSTLYIMTTIIILFFGESAWCNYLANINVLFGIVSAVGLSGYFLEKIKWKTNSFLSEGSFFVYAYHGIALSLIIKGSFRILKPDSEWTMIAIYFICPIITISVGLLFYYWLRKFLPKTTSVITGGR